MIKIVMMLFLLTLFTGDTPVKPVCLTLWPEGTGEGRTGPELSLRLSLADSYSLPGTDFALYLGEERLSLRDKIPLDEYELAMKGDKGRPAELTLSFKGTPCRIYRFIYDGGKRGIQPLKRITVWDGRNNRLYSLIMPAPRNFLCDG